MLSLDGKATPLARQVRATSVRPCRAGRGAALRGLRPVPSHPRRRLHLSFDSRAASTRRPATTDRLGFAVRQVRPEKRDARRQHPGRGPLAVEALYDAADDDPATAARPDRKIYLLCDRDGGQHPPADRGRDQRGGEQWSRRLERTRRLIAPCPRTNPAIRSSKRLPPWPCSLRLTRAGPARPLGDARKGIARGRSAVVLTSRAASCWSPRTHLAAQISELYDRIGSRRRPLQRVREPAPGRRADGRPQRPAYAAGT